MSVVIIRVNSTLMIVRSVPRRMKALLLPNHPRQPQPRQR
jgi:hypothetical protein